MQEYRQQNPSKYQQLYSSVLKTINKGNKYNTISDVLKENNATFTPRNNNSNGKVNGVVNGKVNGVINGKVNAKPNFLSSLKRTKTVQV